MSMSPDNEQYGMQNRDLARERLVAPWNQVPQVRFYDFTRNGDEAAFREALVAFPGEGVYKEAEYADIWLPDIAALDKPKGYYDDHPEELAEYIRMHDTPETSVVVEYPWEYYGRFVKVPRQPEMRRVLQSRTFEIISDEAKEQLATKRIGIAGLGVGTAIGLDLVSAGAEKITAVDGGILKPHDGNRQRGPFIRSVGENHAIYFAKQALQLNPWADINSQPINVSRNGELGTYPIQTLVAESAILFDEMDALKEKAALRNLAWQQGKPVIQMTDIGTHVVIQVDDPVTGDYPCGGRLTPQMYDMIMNLPDRIDPETFATVAIGVFVGQQNVPEEFMRVVASAQRQGVWFMPQSGIAGSKGGGYAAETVKNLFEGRAVPAERLAR